jgi:hypothetical protein
MYKALATTNTVQDALNFWISTFALRAQKTLKAKNGKASKQFACAAFALAL